MSDTQERFKKTLKMIESSGGRNVIPKYSDPRYGTASGVYQVTPATVQSLPQRLKNAGLPIDPAIQDLVNEYPEERNPKDYAGITRTINTNPELDEKIGTAQTGLELKNYDNDVLKAAFSHHTGRTAPETTEGLLNTPADSDYIRKFLDSYSQSSPDTNILDREKFKQTRGKIK